MADLFSLNRARKRRDKEAAEKRAQINRAKFGRTKLERELAVSEESRSNKTLDQLRLPKGDAT